MKYSKTKLNIDIQCPIKYFGHLVNTSQIYEFYCIDKYQTKQQLEAFLKTDFTFLVIFVNA